MDALIKKQNCVELACCFGTHANGITELTLPNNVNITIYGFLSAFQLKEKNNWSTFGKHEKAVSWLQQNFRVIF